MNEGINGIITTTKLEYDQNNNNSNNKVKQNISTERRTLTIVWVIFRLDLDQFDRHLGTH